jgi:proton glutamate symport protein
MRKIALHWQILIALVGAVLAGSFLTDYVQSIEFIGTLFIKALKMIIVPLIGTSIITGIASIGQTGNIGRLGSRTFAYYISSSLFAIVVGLALVNAIRPGDGADLGLQQKPENLEESVSKFGETPADAVQRLLLDVVPSNPFHALSEGIILQVILFCLLFGYFTTRLDEEHREPILGFFNSAFGVMMKMTQFIITFAPIGIFALVSNTVAKTGIDAFANLGLYALTVVLALLVHAFLTLPILMFAIARINPLKHIKAMAPALLTAFSTSSSSATLPLTLQSLERRAGVSNKVSSFVAPLGATINMDGTALYECIAAMFIAQAYGIELSAMQQGLVIITALLASIGAAGIPMAGLVMLSVILTAVGLPLEGLGIILAVDRILDMCRTTVNVWSDSTGAAIVARKSGEDLY